MTGTARYTTNIMMWAALACAALFCIHHSPAEAQSRENQTLGNRVGQRVLEIIETEAEDNWRAAADGYGQVLAWDGLTAFERATLLRLRGRAFYELDQSGRTIQDWRAALELGVLPVEDANTLRINTGQVMIAEEDYAGGIGMIEHALALGVPLNTDLAFRLAQAHAQIDSLDEGLEYARFAFDNAEPRTRSQYSMLLYYLERLERYEQQLSLLEAMLVRWPGEKTVWSRFAGVLSHLERDQESFDVVTVMYVNGMLTEADELVRLARYYQAFGYPYRGAVILEREINSGRVDANPAEHRLLASLWRDAREWDRALPVLRRVATMTGIGTDYEALGEALYQNREFEEAETMLRQALRQGGLNRPGDTWSLIGNSLVEQDRAGAALHAFEQALDWEYSRASAQGWINFIGHQADIQRGWTQLQQAIAIEECGIRIERERRTVPTRETRFTADGRRLFALEEPCQIYFNEYGDLRPEYEPS